MAIIYVDSNATGAATGASWTDALTTLNAALTDVTYAWTDGDEIWVAHNHTEGTGTVTWTATNDTIDNRVPIYRVNSGTDVYSPSTGADTKQYNASTAGADITMQVSCSVNGLYLYADDNIYLATNVESLRAEDCCFELNTAISQLVVGSANTNNTADIKGGIVRFNNTTGGYIWVCSANDLRGVTFEGYSFSSGLLRPQSNSRANYQIVERCDFSNLLSSTTYPLIEISGTSEQHWHLISCAIKSGQTIFTSGGFANDNQFVYVHNTDSAGNTYVTSYHCFRGDVQEDTTVYYRGKNAYVDIKDSTPLSHAMIPASNVDISSPLISIDMYGLIETTGAKNFAVEIAENYTSALTKRDCWIEVEYLGSAGSSLWSMIHDREFAQTTYTALPTGSGTDKWVNGPTGFRSAKATASATIGQIGLYRVRLYLSKYENTKEFYYNPVVTITDG